MESQNKPMKRLEIDTESELLCDLKTAHRDPKLAVLPSFCQLDTLESSQKREPH